MSILSTTILELGFTSERDMEEALARQVMYGGDLGSNLLELGLLTEEQLLEASARSSGLERVPAGELPPTPSALAELLPASEQRRFGVHVLGEEDGHVVVAVAEKLPVPTEAELSRVLNRPLTQRIACWARLEQAAARAGASTLSERALHLLKRLEGRPSVGPLAPGLPVDFKQLPRPQSVPPVEFTFAAHDFDVATAPPPEGYVELAQAQAQLARDASDYVRAPLPLTPTTTSVRRRGPYTAAMAERDLLEAEDRHEVLTAFFDFVAQYFEYTALFVLKGGQAVGYRARGSGAGSERLRTVHIPLDLPSAFSRARDEKTWVLTRLRAGGIEGGLARDISRSVGRKVLILPLLVKDRPVVFLYGDHGTVDVDLTSVGDILSFAPLASAALERVILRQKGLGRLPALAALRPRPNPLLPTRDEQAQALMQVVRATAPPPPPPPDPSLGEGSAPQDSSPEGSSSPSSGQAPGAEPRAPHQAGHQPLHSTARSWTHRFQSSPPFPSRQPRTLPGVAAPANPPPELPPVGEPGAIQVRPTVSLGPEPSEAAASQSSFEAPPPPRGLWSEPPEDGWDIDTTFEDHEHGTAAGVGPLPPTLSSRPTTRLSQPPTAPGDYASLVDRICAGDTSALDLLLEGGDQAVAALVGRFPGPLTRPDGGPAGGRASECGPVLNALVRLGPPVIPYLTVRTADEDAQVREWATRLLGELPSREAAQAVARRLVDDALEVRRAALAAARMLQEVPEAREGTRTQLEELAWDTALPAQVRRAAIEALTDLREADAVPSMIQLLGDADREVSGAARWSLVVLTRQDFGADQDYWSRFWAANRSRHRVEWLIDALTHESRDIRRAAGDELKNVTKEYFGYYDDLPEAERERVQQTYRAWWEREGRARFEGRVAAPVSLRP